MMKVPDFLTSILNPSDCKDEASTDTRTTMHKLPIEVPLPPASSNATDEEEDEGDGEASVFGDKVGFRTFDMSYFECSLWKFKISILQYSNTYDIAHI